jgi:FMN phosphatase YigB (HAD superfamily)
VSADGNARDNRDIGPIRGVIFDLDGTLYTVSWLKLNIAVGMLFDSKLLSSLFKARDAIRGTAFESRDALLSAFTAELGALTGKPPKKVLRWYQERFMPRFVKVLGSRGKMRPGLLELLGHLRKEGVRTAVVSDFGLVDERLEALGIPVDLFDEVTGAEDFGVMKPTAVPYLHLAGKWGLRPGEVLLVGDRRDQDQKSAELSGTTFVGIAVEDDVPAEPFLAWADVIRFIRESV